MANPKKSVRRRKIETLHRDPRPVLYANNAAIMITPWDLRFQFGQVIEATETEMKVQEEISVYMSPQHAKAFSQVLDRIIQVYEEKYGSIPEPEGRKEPQIIS